MKVDRVFTAVMLALALVFVGATLTRAFAQGTTVPNEPTNIDTRCNAEVVLKAPDGGEVRIAVADVPCDSKGDIRVQLSVFGPPPEDGTIVLVFSGGPQ